MRNHKMYKICVGILLLLVIFIVGDLWLSSNFLTVNEYEFTTEKAARDVNLVVLSDLHDHEFGTGNEKLAQKVKEQNPDLILLAGDILNKDSKNADVPCELIKKLVGIAPVYYSLGNHELMYIDNDHQELIQQLQEAGAVVLEKKYVDLKINETFFRLGGMYDYAFGIGGNNFAIEAPEDIKEFLEDYQDTEHLKIMMAHRPDSFIFGDAASFWDVDLVVSGHNHGGQVVIPLLGGLYGGDQGWFPKYLHGMYKKDKVELFVTSGLGSHAQFLKRFNNPPEIAVVRICSI